MLDREAAIAWYRRNRARSRALFDLLEADVYYKKPIELRHPIVFYEGHLPAFSFNTLVKKALGGPASMRGWRRSSPAGSIRTRSQADPTAGPKGPATADRCRPGPFGPGSGLAPRDEVHAFAAEADRRVLEALCGADLDRPGHPLLDRAEAVFTILEHEAMHHETLLYMWHRLPFEDKRRPVDYTVGRTYKVRPTKGSPRVGGGSGWPRHAGGRPRDLVFGWDNEFRVDGPMWTASRSNATT